MIYIENIDKNPRETGSHTYQIRVNNKTITTFSHDRKDPLSMLFIKALRAIVKMESIKIMEKL
jgi:hypothetical protein